MFFHALDRGADELREIADNAHVIAGGQQRAHFLQPLLHRVDHLDGVRARLAADREEHRRAAVDARLGLGDRHAVLDGGDVAKQDRMSVALADDDVAERSDRGDAPARPQRQRRSALLDASARDLGVLRLQRARHVGDREVVGAQPVGVERHVDLPRPSANDDDLANAGNAFQLPAQLLVGVFGDVADRLVGRERERQHRRRVGIELLDCRLVDVARQDGKHAVDAIADFLRGDVGILLEQERDDHHRDAFRRGRTQLVDAADRIDRFFDPVGELGFDFLRRRTGKPRRHDDGGEVDFREAVEAELREGKGADDRERNDENAREHRTPDGESCQPLHDVYFFSE